MLVFEDEFARLAQADFCAVPGYLVLQVKTGEQSAGALTPRRAARLGELLARSTAAIEAVVGADRVYCLSFCEVDRGLHFHLFPRTPEILAAYQTATDAGGQPVNGPSLFEWARDAYPAGSPLPPNFATEATVCEKLRALFI
jgi:diadenosine tetraphosphate (Ap4A) HIT family hydrolase